MKRVSRVKLVFSSLCDLCSTHRVDAIQQQRAILRHTPRRRRTGVVGVTTVKMAHDPCRHTRLLEPLLESFCAIDDVYGDILRVKVFFPRPGARGRKEGTHRVAWWYVACPYQIAGLGVQFGFGKQNICREAGSQNDSLSLQRVQQDTFTSWGSTIESSIIFRDMYVAVIVHHMWKAGLPEHTTPDRHARPSALRTNPRLSLVTPLW